MLEIIDKNELITDRVNNLLSEGYGEFLFCPDDLMVHIGLNKEYNKEYCDEHNIFTLYIPRVGGTIVCTDEDVDYFGVTYYDKDRGMDFLDTFKL